MAGACFLLGRVCIINERLRRRNDKKSRTITELRASVENMNAKNTTLTRTLAALQCPVSTVPKTYFVESLADIYIVYMAVPMPDGQLAVPVKTFHDAEDPAFAYREAVEFKEKCEEI